MIEADLSIDLNVSVTSQDLQGRGERQFLRPRVFPGLVV